MCTCTYMYIQIHVWRPITKKMIDTYVYDNSDVYTTTQTTPLTM